MQGPLLKYCQLSVRILRTEFEKFLLNRESIKSQPKPYCKSWKAQSRKAISPFAQEIRLTKGDFAITSDRSDRWKPLRVRSISHRQGVSAEKAPNSRLPRLAYVSPMPPAKTGIADYSAHLVPELAKYYSIDVIVDQAISSKCLLPAGVDTRSIKYFVENASSYDRIIYHAGNSDFHRIVFSLNGEFPGIVVLHDLFLGHLLAHLHRPSGVDGPERHLNRWRRSIRKRVDRFHLMLKRVRYFIRPGYRIRKRFDRSQLPFELERHSARWRRSIRKRVARLGLSFELKRRFVLWGRRIKKSVTPSRLSFFPIRRKARYPALIQPHRKYESHGYWIWALYLSHGYGAAKIGTQTNRREDAIFDFPASFVLIQKALGIIVHSEHSRSLARKFYAAGSCENWEIVPFARRQPDRIEKAAARRALGISGQAFLICSFGFLGPTKLNHRLVEAWLESELASDQSCSLVFVGEIANGPYLETLRKMMSACPRITITGYVDPAVYYNYLRAADAAVQLRTLSRGETSAALLDCLKCGLPTVVNAHGSMIEIPNNVAIKISDVFGTAELTSQLEHLRSNQQLRSRLADAAHDYGIKFLSPEFAAKSYQHSIEKIYENNSYSGPSSSFDRAKSKPAQRQIFVDVSALVREDLKSGIQRVVKEQLLALIENPPEGFRIEPVYLAERDSVWNLRYARKYTCDLINIPSDHFDDESAELCPGDIYFGADFFADGVLKASRAKLFQFFREAGVLISFAVYDTLPIQFPKFFPEGTSEIHEEWLREVAISADALICISDDVKNRVRSFLKGTIDNKLLPDLTVVHLGADIPVKHLSNGIPIASIEKMKVLGERPTFLMVGTIEPRKGHLQVINAFDQLWREGIDVNLVIIGAEGWKPVPFERRRTIPLILEVLRGHNEFGKRLFWFERTSDEELTTLYRHSSCLIAASEGEGFGLPLIEAAHYGLPLLVRDLEVFKEVAGCHASYFSGFGPEGLAEAVKAWLLLYAAGTHPRSDDLPHLNWKQSTEILVAALTKIQTKRPKGRI